MFQAIAYGVVQGLTEFLPISSSAHLILLPLFTGWPDPGLAFDVALHWGTLLAVVVYFRKDLVHIFTGFFGFAAGQREPNNRLAWYITIATVPGAALGFLFEKQAETMFRTPLLLACTLSIMGLLLFVADRIGSKTVTLDTINWKKALLIGLAQGVAIVPGVSRSGVTITTGLFLGLSREDAIRFSFFLAMPITFGAGLLKIGYLVHNAGDPLIWIALVTSALSGFSAVHILMTYIRTRSFTPFVVYRLAMAAFIAVWLFTGMR